ncbi:MAG: DUF1330 domain-containing protein [Gammaproteobacteria bacterium]|nr:DUF1330 domain-containing protein [Gammaproteobacteria bacterium]
MTNPTSAVNPSDESIAALRSRPDDDPIVMVNLLKYAEPGGRERYARYGTVAGREIAARGGRVLYSGNSLAGDHWDGVALVYYPRRAAWLDMQDSPAYQAAIADRTAGLAARLLYAFTRGAGPLPVTPPPLEDMQRNSDEEVFVVNLLRYHGDEGRASFFRYGEVAARLIQDLGGNVELSLAADQAMVSDDEWEHFVLVRYPSFEALQSMLASDEWQAANNAYREPGMAGTIAFPTR